MVCHGQGESTVGNNDVYINWQKLLCSGSVVGGRRLSLLCVDDESPYIYILSFFSRFLCLFDTIRYFSDDFKFQDPDVKVNGIEGTTA